jgi:protein-disulfide isomerase
MLVAPGVPSGTPAFFFNGQMHGGEISLEELDALIAPMLPKT